MSHLTPKFEDNKSQLTPTKTLLPNESVVVDDVIVLYMKKRKKKVKAFIDLKTIDKPKVFTAWTV